MQEEPILLWPEGVPDAVGDEDADRPTLTPYRPAPDEASGASMVVCPGGAYGALAEHEGGPVAEWLTTLGVTAFVLKYRLAPRYRHPAMLMDVQRAVKTIKARAAAADLDANRVGVLGFSAGGHLASCAATLVSPSDRAADDGVEHWNSRPAATVLAYPVVDMEEHCHEGSRTNLLGDEGWSDSAGGGAKPDPKLLSAAEDLLNEIRDLCGETAPAALKGAAPPEKEDPRTRLLRTLSTHRQVTAETPPAFLVHSVDDPAVPAENSVLYARALRACGVPVELHCYEEGGHGWGLAAKHSTLSTWTGLCARWLQLRGFVGRMGLNP